MPTRLTPRQLEILSLMSKGLSNKEICNLLGISNNTVKIHVASVLRTLGAANRTEAVFSYQQMLEEERRAKESSGPQKMQLVDRLGRPAVAVLPFESLLDGASDDAVMQGLVEELLVRLSACKWFPVIAYASSRRCDPVQQQPQEIGRDLAARYLIYGSLRKAGEQVRITVRLVDAVLGQEIWSRTFDTDYDDLFQLQESIATHIVAVVAPELDHAEALQSRQASVSDGSAWQLFCRGMALIKQHDLQSAGEALVLFERAIELAPDFSLAYHGKVRALQLQLFEQWVEDRQAAILAVKECVDVQLRLEPNGHHALMDAGYLHILAGDKKIALEYLQAAADANPSSTATLSMLAQGFGMAGRLDEAIMHLEEILALDPRAPSIARYRTILGMCHTIAGRPEEGLEWSQDAIARDPQAHGAYLAMIAAYVDLDQQNDALDAVKRLLQNNPDFDVSARIAMMRPFCQPELLEHLVDNLRLAGLNVA
ncbi:MAG: LuxR C-terminal-related transcriptional regulator [Pseudomonadota bacterium]